MLLNKEASPVNNSVVFGMNLFLFINDYIERLKKDRGTSAGLTGRVEDEWINLD